jgi:hypothetical protein
MPRIKGPDGTEFDVDDGAVEEDIVAAWEAAKGQRPGVLRELAQPSLDAMGGLGEMVRRLAPDNPRDAALSTMLPMLAPLLASPKLLELAKGMVGELPVNEQILPTNGAPETEGSGILGAVGRGAVAMGDERRPMGERIRGAATVGTAGMAEAPMQNVANSPHPVARAIGEAIPFTLPEAVASGPGRAALSAAARPAGKAAAAVVGKVTNAEKYAEALKGTEKIGKFNPNYEGEIRRALASGEITSKQAVKLRMQAKARRAENASVPDMPLTVSERLSGKGEAGQRAREIESRVPNSPGGGMAREMRAQQQEVAAQWKDTVLRRAGGHTGDLDSLHTQLKTAFEGVYDARKQAVGARIRGITKEVDAALGKPMAPTADIVDTLRPQLAEWGKFPPASLERDIYDIAMASSAEGRMSVENAWLLRRKIDDMIGPVKRGYATPEQASLIAVRNRAAKVVDDTIARAGKKVQTEWQESLKAYAANERMRKRTYVKGLIESRNSKAIAATLMGAVPEDLSLTLGMLPKKLRRDAVNTVLADTLDSVFKQSETAGVRMSGQQYRKLFAKRFTPEKMQVLFDPVTRAEVYKHLDAVGRVADARKNMSAAQAVISYGLLPAAGATVGSVAGGVAGAATGVALPVVLNKGLAKAFFSPGGTRRFQTIADTMKRLRASEMTPELAAAMSKGAYGVVAARAVNQMLKDAGKPDEGDEADPLAGGF